MLEKARSANPESTEVLRPFIIEAMRSGQSAKAFSAAQELESKSSELGDRYLVASVLLQQKQYLAASHILEDYVAQRPKDARPRLSQNGKPVRQFADLSTYAEKMLLHENALVKITNEIALDRAALIGCGVTTGVGAVLNTAKIEPGSTVAVFGCGGVGISAIQGARIAGARKIIAVDQFESKLAMAKRFGATDTVDASNTDAVESIKTMTGGGVDYSFEAVGVKRLAEQCFECIKPGGTATIIGMIPVGQKVELDGSKFLTERKIQGTMMGGNRFRIDMPRYIDFYLQNRLNLDDMISKRGNLEDVNEAFRAMKSGEVARTVLMFE